MLPTFDPEAASTSRGVLPQAWREIEIRSQNEWKPSVSREKTHVLHQIGVDIAAETYRVLEIRCEQQNLPAHDPNDPPRQSWVGAENSSSICTCRQGFRKPTCANKCEFPRTCTIVCSADFAVLPVPAHEDCLASVAAVTSFSLPRWVSEMRAASKSEVRM